jgi:pyridoxamine 5'-phosphate oxidase
MENKHLQDLRMDYESGSLDESNILANPAEQFMVWFEEAEKASIPEPNAMTLATCSIDFKPSARIVLLKGIENGAFIFYTNYESRKGKELMWNPYASLLFFWNALHRQVRIEGRVNKVSEEMSDHYFHSRPVGSQLSAFVSNQSEVVPDRKFLEEKLQTYKIKFADEEIPRPETWGGYQLIPAIMEFWQGRPNRLHDRLRYTLHGSEWKIERLAP